VRREKNANTIFNHGKDETLLYVRRRIFCTNRLEEILRRYEEVIWESWEKVEERKKENYSDKTNAWLHTKKKF